MTVENTDVLSPSQMADKLSAGALSGHLPLGLAVNFDEVATMLRTLEARCYELENDIAAMASTTRSPSEVHAAWEELVRTARGASADVIVACYEPVENWTWSELLPPR